MAQKKQKSARTKLPSNSSAMRVVSVEPASSPLDHLRKLLYPKKSFSKTPGSLASETPPDAANHPRPPANSGEARLPDGGAALIQVLADVATCLWYLKTKHFKRDWNDQVCEDDDPRVRRALGRVNKGIDALRLGGVEVEDPTNKRYPAGGEAMMRPLEFSPVVGLTYERVTETVVPIVFLADRLIQRAEVFVAVPPQPPADGRVITVNRESRIEAGPTTHGQLPCPAQEVVISRNPDLSCGTGADAPSPMANDGDNATSQAENVKKPGEPNKGA